MIDLAPLIDSWLAPAGPIGPRSGAASQAQSEGWSWAELPLMSEQQVRSLWADICPEATPEIRFITITRTRGPGNRVQISGQVAVSDKGVAALRAALAKREPAST